RWSTQRDTGFHPGFFSDTYPFLLPTKERFGCSIICESIILYQIDAIIMDKYDYNTGRIRVRRNTHDEYRRENQSGTFSKKRRP
ncbi:MAG: hypothetical protein IJH60_05030, partial [Eubacterium sp.]|nr:hypothetical protein [Eubacterium sp.]